MNKNTLVTLFTSLGVGSIAAGAYVMTTNKSMLLGILCLAIGSFGMLIAGLHDAIGQRMPIDILTKHQVVTVKAVFNGPNSAHLLIEIKPGELLYVMSDKNVDTHGEAYCTGYHYRFNGSNLDPLPPGKKS
jgi:hypothetical protein